METQTFILDAINRLTDLNLKSNLLLKCVNSVCFLNMQDFLFLMQ